MLHSPRKISWLTVDQWQSYVENHANSSIFHHRSWLELLSEQYGFEIQIPAIVDNGTICGAIPFLQTRNLWRSKKLISLPFTDYLPILVDNQKVLEDLCQLIQYDARGGFETVVVRADQHVPGTLHESHVVRHDLCTNKPFSEIESSFASSIKRNLHKGKRRQLEFRKRSDAEAMETFYRLHVKTRKKIGIPVQPKSFFRRLNEKLIKTGLGFVVVVTKGTAPIAAGVLLRFNGRLVYKYAASDPAALEHRPNDWLVYNAIRMAAEENFQYFDFGISDKAQDGLRRFKRKWGAIESDIFYSYVVGQPEANVGQSRAVRLAGYVIKRSPSAVCRVLGQAFYKYSQ